MMAGVSSVGDPPPLKSQIPFSPMTVWGQHKGSVSQT